MSYCTKGYRRLRGALTTRGWIQRQGILAGSRQASPERLRIAGKGQSQDEGDDEMRRLRESWWVVTAALSSLLLMLLLLVAGGAGWQ